MDSLEVYLPGLNITEFMKRCVLILLKGASLHQAVGHAIHS